MVIRIYALICLLVVAAAGALYFAGNLNDMTFTVFGFIVSTLFAAGFVGVLPWWVSKRYTWRY